MHPCIHLSKNVSLDMICDVMLMPVYIDRKRIPIMNNKYNSNFSAAALHFLLRAAHFYTHLILNTGLCRTCEKGTNKFVGKSTTISESGGGHASNTMYRPYRFESFMFIFNGGWQHCASH